jgi:DNA replicative helicase MCM subunit Mcm2 (Cdc46/Mcm family)
MQELAEHVPKGHIPRSMTVHFRGELTRKVGNFKNFIEGTVSISFSTREKAPSVALYSRSSVSYFKSPSLVDGSKVFLVL